MSDKPWDFEVFHFLHQTHIQSQLMVLGLANNDPPLDSLMNFPFSELFFFGNISQEPLARNVGFLHIDGMTACQILTFVG